MKIGDLVRYKKSALRGSSCDATRTRINEKKPMLIIGMRGFFAEVIEGDNIFYAYLNDLTKRGLR